MLNELENGKDPDEQRESVGVWSVLPAGGCCCCCILSFHSSSIGYLGLCIRPLGTSSVLQSHESLGKKKKGKTEICRSARGGGANRTRGDAA